MKIIKKEQIKNKPLLPVNAYVFKGYAKNIHGKKEYMSINVDNFAAEWNERSIEELLKEIIIDYEIMLLIKEPYKYDQKCLHWEEWFWEEFPSDYHTSCRGTATDYKVIYYDEDSKSFDCSFEFTDEEKQFIETQSLK